MDTLHARSRANPPRGRCQISTRCHANLGPARLTAVAILVRAVTRGERGEVVAAVVDGDEFA
jgi:hypothetical protein